MRSETLVAQVTSRLTRSAHDGDEDRVLTLSEGVITANSSLEVLAVNGAAADLLGFTPDALVRHLNDSDWSVLDGDLRRELQVALAMRGRWEGPARLPRADGSTIDTVLTACILHGSAGLPSGVTVIIRPVLAGDRPAPTAEEGDSFRVNGLPGHFFLYYQPEIDLRTGAIASCEALLRWWHPGLGIVSPGPALAHPKWAARLAGLEVWSIFASCRQAAAWAKQGRRLPVSLNVSNHHLADPELLGRLHRAMVVTDVPVTSLSVDLPMSAVVQTPDLARKVAGFLADAGVALSLDDVPEQTSPGALDGLHASAVKLERRATRTAHHGGSDAAVTSVIDLARRLGATATAKAVETPEQLTRLHALGCDRAFGHLFSPPRPPTDLEAMLGDPSVDPLAPLAPLPWAPPGPA